MTRGITASVALVCALVFAAPAAAASTLDFSAFSVRSGSLSEVVSFQGDGGPACAQAGVCGYNGTIDYGFGGIRDGEGTLLVSHSGRRSRAFGFANLDLGALTTVTVNSPGAGQPCTEKVLHRFDGFALEGTAKRLRVLFHPAEAAPDFLDSYCAGPSDADIAHAQALPAPTIATSRLRQRKFVLTTASQRPFHAGPFVGTVTFNASFVLSRVNLPRDLLNALTQSRR